MPDRLIDQLELDGRFMRSIALDRDLTDVRALESYLITPSVVAALRQIGQTLHEHSPQRAWKIVGPYGSGKSALGLLIAHLLEGPKRHRKVFEKLAEASPSTEQLFRPGANRLPVALVGSRSSIGDAMAHQILKLIESWDKTRQTTALRKKIDLNATLYDGRPLSVAAIDLLRDFVVIVQNQGYSGVLLLVDEMGKFVEHAALSPENGDLIVLQKIAELACHPEDDSLIVVTMLHQHFSEYARGVGRSLEDEWHKVAARFEEIAFDEPIERYVQFAAHSLGVKLDKSTNELVQMQAKNLYDEAQKRSILRFQGANDTKILKAPQNLYPLHPLAIASMAVVAKRYGQSERSFHAFLRGHELFGLRDFATRHSVNANRWMGLHDVFDFLASGHSLRLRDLSLERRWAFACSTVERAENKLAVDMSVFKCVAVLELAHSVLRLSTTPDLLHFALAPALQIPEIDQALESLVSRGLLLHRRQRDEYVLAVSDAINIEALFEEANQHSEDELILLGIRRLTSNRSVIANRHYDRTGVIRTMKVLVGTADAWPKSDQGLDDEVKPDGYYHVVLVDQGSPQEKSLVSRKLKETDEPLTLSSALSLSPTAKQALINHSKWCLVHDKVSRKRIDPWTNRYVEVRAAEAREEVERLVLSELIPQDEKPGPGFYHLGAIVADGTHMNLSRAASWLFDSVFPNCPRVVNELINKDKPTPAITLARQRLFELLLSGMTDTPLFAQGDFPPERLITSTLLRDTEILVEDEQGSWKLRDPIAGATLDITYVWAKIGELLRRDERPSFADVLEELSKPPLGLRVGPAGVWVVMYLLTRMRSCAVFERSTFILELTVDHLARMFKNPGQFYLRELPLNDENMRLLHDYRNGLAAVGYEPEGPLSHLEVARSVIRWASRLSEYSTETLSISVDAKLVRTTIKRATDPIAMLAKELPENFAQSKSKGESFDKWFASALAEISLTHRRLQDEVTRALAEGFSLSGSLKQIRTQLQLDCAEAVTELADPRLKSFILRCTDLTLTDEKWLDSIASLLVQRPIDAWKDETLSQFRQALVELCGHYKRWIKLIRQSGRSKRAGERFLAVTMTLPDGEETSVFISASVQAKQLAVSVIKSAVEQAHGDNELALASLAQALTELQQKMVVNTKGYDERKAG